MTIKDKFNFIKFIVICKIALNERFEVVMKITSFRMACWGLLSYKAVLVFKIIKELGAMCEYIELSYTIENGLPTHPYDDELKLYRNRFLDKDKYNDSRLETGMHTGTHIDVVSHLSDTNTFICDYPVDKFIGKGCLLDVRNQAVIHMKEEYLNIVKENDIVFLYTGFDEQFGKASYFNHHPVIEKKLAEFFANIRIKMLGMDLPSPDQYPFEIHHILLKKDVLIIENMRNLGSLMNVGQFEVIALPLKIKTEASPVRVVARVQHIPINE